MFDLQVPESLGPHAEGYELLRACVSAGGARCMQGRRPIMDWHRCALAAGKSLPEGRQTFCVTQLVIFRSLFRDGSRGMLAGNPSRPTGHLS